VTQVLTRLNADRDDVEWLSYPGLASGAHAHPQAACAAQHVTVRSFAKGNRFDVYAITR